jgi:hypothetical protein
MMLECSTNRIKKYSLVSENTHVWLLDISNIQEIEYAQAKTILDNDECSRMMRFFYEKQRYEFALW